MTAKLSQNETLRVDKFAAFSCYLDNTESLQDSARELVAENKTLGFEVLKVIQAKNWAKHWENGDVVIEGNPADQQAVRFSLFQLRQQLVTTNQCSIGATGLTGPGYSGKVFWDTEMYLMPL